MGANGQLSLAELSPAAGGIVGPFEGSGQLANDAAAAWNALNAVCVSQNGAHLTCNGPSSLYRNLAMQQYFWHLYQTGQGNLAAYPGSSNHGWGLASDTPPYVWALFRAHPEFGWGPCSDAPSEAWHRKWCGNWHGKDPGGGDQKPRYPTLRKGNKGGAVKRLQKHLDRWNKGLTSPSIDGRFGPKTKKAVVQFQLVHGLKADGIVGHETWAKVRLKDHFTATERYYLNRLRLAHAREQHGHKPSKAERQQIRRWRGHCAHEAHAVQRVARRRHDWKHGYRLVRFKQLRHAAGKSF